MRCPNCDEAEMITVEVISAEGRSEKLADANWCPACECLQDVVQVP